MVKLSGLYDSEIPEEEIIKNSKHPKRTEAFRKGPFYLLFIVSIIVIVKWHIVGIKFKHEIYTLGISIGFLTIIGAAKTNKLIYEKARFIELIKYPTILFIFLLACAITNGCADGYQFININCNNETNKDYKMNFPFLSNFIITKNDNNLSSIDFKNKIQISSQCARNFDKGGITRSLKKLTFTPWEEIRSIIIE